jgi:hypothetical protein
MRMTEPFMHIRPEFRQNKYKMAVRVSEYPATGLHYAHSIYAYTIYHRTMDTDTTIPTTLTRPPLLIKRTKADNRPNIFHGHNFN